MLLQGRGLLQEFHVIDLLELPAVHRRRLRGESLRMPRPIVVIEQQRDDDHAGQVGDQKSHQAAPCQ